MRFKAFSLTSTLVFCGIALTSNSVQAKTQYLLREHLIPRKDGVHIAQVTQKANFHEYGHTINRLRNESVDDYEEYQQGRISIDQLYSKILNKFQKAKSAQNQAAQLLQRNIYEGSATKYTYAQFFDKVTPMVWQIGKNVNSVGQAIGKSTVDPYPKVGMPIARQQSQSATSSTSQSSQAPLKYAQDSVNAMCSDPMMRMMMPGCAGGGGTQNNSARTDKYCINLSVGDQKPADETRIGSSSVVGNMPNHTSYICFGGANAREWHNGKRSF